MLCDRCHGREATVHVTQIINGRRSEQHLCQECAAKEHVMQSSFGRLDRDFFSSPIESFFEGRMPSFFGRNPIEIESQPVEEEQEGPMFQEGLRRSPDSYEAFREKIRPAFQKKQADVSEAKEVPVETEDTPTDPKLAELKKALKSCISREDYEGAARIRDQIREMEK